MKRAIVIGALSALVSAVPALAAKPPHPTHPVHPVHPTTPNGQNSGSGGGGNANGGSKSNCSALNKGYYATGTLVSGTLTPGSKAGTFDGTLTVTVSRANHKSATPSQTFTLAGARVHFGKGVTSTTLAAGDRVTVHGKITALRHGCDSTGFTSATTIHGVTIKAPKASHS
jgi:hypothetical protein